MRLIRIRLSRLRPARLVRPTARPLRPAARLIRPTARIVLDLVLRLALWTAWLGVTGAVFLAVDLRG
jgi:hypothetical protein